MVFGLFVITWASGRQIFIQCSYLATNTVIGNCMKSETIKHVASGIYGTKCPNWVWTLTPSQEGEHVCGLVSCLSEFLPQTFPKTDCQWKQLWISFPFCLWAAPPTSNAGPSSWHHCGCDTVFSPSPDFAMPTQLLPITHKVHFSSANWVNL